MFGFFRRDKQLGKAPRRQKGKAQRRSPGLFMSAEPLEDRLALALVTVNEIEQPGTQALVGGTEYRVNGSIATLTDTDRFSFRVRAGDVITLNARATNPNDPTAQQFDPMVGLYNPSGTLVDQDDDGGTGSDWAAGLTFTANVAGLWVVAVTDFNDNDFDGVGGNGDGFGTDTGAYVLDITGAEPPTPTPEVTVIGNGATIADGDTTPSLNDHTDFGSRIIGDSPIIRTFTVRNVGSAPLTLGAVTVPAGFTLTNGLVANLAPGAADTITVQMETATVGTKSGQITFTSNDSDESPYNFSISGLVTLPGGLVPVTDVAATDGTIRDYVRVSWGSQPNATSYDVLRNITNNPGSATVLATSLADIKFDDVTAQPGQAYFYWVRAKNNVATTPLSAANLGYRPLNAATNVEASDGAFPGFVRITWTPPVGATRYEVWRSNTNNIADGKMIAAQITSARFDDTTAELGKTYFYFVRAKTQTVLGPFSRSDAGSRFLDAADPDDQLAEVRRAKTMNKPAGYRGDLGGPTDVDMYAFNVQRGQRIAFDLDSAGGLDSFLRLFDAAGTQLAFAHDGPAGGDAYFEFDQFAAGGTYYIGVSSSANRTYSSVFGTGDTAGTMGDYYLMVTPMTELPTNLVGQNKLTGELNLPDPGTHEDRTKLSLTRVVADRRGTGVNKAGAITDTTTWVVIHGQGDSPKDVESLAAAIDATDPNDQVLLLDWSKGAKDDPAGAPDPSVWVPLVGDWTAEVLAQLGVTGSEINLVGHGTGAYAAYEIAARTNGGKVQSVVALDPAAPGEYDDTNVNFKAVANNSWAFDGNGPLGSRDKAGKAEASFVLDYNLAGGVPDAADMHDAPLFLFDYLVRRSLAALPNGQPHLFTLGDLLSANQSSPWEENQFTRAGFTVFEGVFTMADGTGVWSTVEMFDYIDAVTGLPVTVEGGNL